MNIKYTTDGKKVIVVGKLNNQETIVQEIFIVDNNEIPSGENLVVKSLHDAPAVSWKQKEIEKMELAYEQARKNNDIELSNLRSIQKRARSMYEGCAAIVKNTNSKMFESVAKMIGGEYKFVLANTWSGIEILPIENMAVKKDGYDYELRMMTIFGRSNGDFSWHINDYRDDSGSWRTFFPYETEEQAIKKAVELIEENEYSLKSIEFLKKNNLPVNHEKLTAYYESEEQKINIEIEKSQKSIDDLKASLANLKNKRVVE